jgi:hypothetical protein
MYVLRQTEYVLYDELTLKKRVKIAYRTAYPRQMAALGFAENEETTYEGGHGVVRDDNNHR